MPVDFLDPCSTSLTLESTRTCTFVYLVLSPSRSSGSVYATVARRYSTLPTGTGFSNVLGSSARKLGRACENEAAQQKASSKDCFSRKPPKIMKLWRLRSCG